MVIVELSEPVNEPSLSVTKRVAGPAGAVLLFALAAGVNTKPGAPVEPCGPASFNKAVIAVKVPVKVTDELLLLTDYTTVGAALLSAVTVPLVTVITAV